MRLDARVALADKLAAFHSSPSPFTYLHILSFPLEILLEVVTAAYRMPVVGLCL